MSPVPDLRLSVPGGIGVPAPFALVPGTKLGPVAVGSEGDWRIDANGVPPLACYLLFDGQTLFVSAISPAVSVGERRVGREWYALPVPTDVHIGAATLSVVPGLETIPVDSVVVRKSPLPPPRVSAATPDHGLVTRATIIAPRQALRSPVLDGGGDAGPRRDKRARPLVVVPCVLIAAAAAVALAGEQLHGDPLWGLRGGPTPRAHTSAPARTSLPAPRTPAVQVTPPTSLPAGATAAPLPQGEPVPNSAPIRPLPPKAGPPAGTASPATTRLAERTLEQRAIEAAAHGSFGLAALMYEELARENPDVPAYAEAARILAEPRH
jgi:hypothetical protein